ncbi:hypothetical protein QYM36_004835, partial [Artemia franciscana]
MNTQSNSSELQLVRVLLFQAKLDPLSVIDTSAANSALAVVNANLNNMLNVKDSRWLQLEVCREFQRNKCTRPDTECKFAHPPAHVEVQNGRVTACYDSIK